MAFISFCFTFCHLKVVKTPNLTRRFKQLTRSPGLNLRLNQFFGLGLILEIKTEINLVSDSVSQLRFIKFRSLTWSQNGDSEKSSLRIGLETQTQRRFQPRTRSWKLKLGLADSRERGCICLYIRSTTLSQSVNSYRLPPSNKRKWKLNASIFPHSLLIMLTPSFLLKIDLF